MLTIFSTVSTSCSKKLMLLCSKIVLFMVNGSATYKILKRVHQSVQ